MYCIIKKHNVKKRATENAFFKYMRRRTRLRDLPDAIERGHKSTTTASTITVQLFRANISKYRGISAVNSLKTIDFERG